MKFPFKIKAIQIDAQYAVHMPIEEKADLIEKYNTMPPTDLNNYVYAVMIQSVDEAVGRVLDTLDESHLFDNTGVIFTSDDDSKVAELSEFTEEDMWPHVGSTSNAPLRWGKAKPYEGGIRVPIIIRRLDMVEQGRESRVLLSRCVLR